MSSLPTTAPVASDLIAACRQVPEFFNVFFDNRCKRSDDAPRDKELYNAVVCESLAPIESVNGLALASKNIGAAIRASAKESLPLACEAREATGVSESKTLPQGLNVDAKGSACADSVLSGVADDVIEDEVVCLSPDVPKPAPDVELVDDLILREFQYFS